MVNIIHAACANRLTHRHRPTVPVHHQLAHVGRAYLDTYCLRVRCECCEERSFITATSHSITSDRFWTQDRLHNYQNFMTYAVHTSIYSKQGVPEMNDTHEQLCILEVYDTAFKISGSEFIVVMQIGLHRESYRPKPCSLFLITFTNFDIFQYFVSLLYCIVG